MSRIYKRYNSRMYKGYSSRIYKGYSSRIYKGFTENKRGGEEMIFLTNEANQFICMSLKLRL